MSMPVPAECRHADPRATRPVAWTSRLGAALATIAVAALVPANSAAAQVLVRDLHPVSMQFRSTAQDAILDHQAQVRSRQIRVRQARQTPLGLPRFVNNLSMSGDEGSIPLRMRDRPAAPAKVQGPKKVAPGTTGVISSFIRGDLHTESDSATGLSTTDLTLGSDYRVSEAMMVGLAVGGLRSAAGTGSTVSAYMTLQPIDRTFLDVSLSYGSHRSRDPRSLILGDTAHAAIQGVSRGFSMTLNHPREVGAWYWSPYSRYDHVTTDVAAGVPSASASPLTFALSAVSLGTTAATTWGTPLGSVRPMVVIEVQRETVTVAGGGATPPQIQGTVGLGMTTRVSRNLLAFAESRYESTLEATLDRQMMLGVRLAF